MVRLILYFVFSVWWGATGVKAGRALAARRPYVFSLWDGGAILADRSLSRRGTLIRLLVSAFGAFALVSVAARILPFTLVRWPLLAAVALEFVCDLTMSHKTKESDPAELRGEEARRLVATLHRTGATGAPGEVHYEDSFNGDRWVLDQHDGSPRLRRLPRRV